MLMMTDTRPNPRADTMTPLVPVNIGHLPMSYPPLQSAVLKASLNPESTGKLKQQVHHCQMEGCNQKSIFYCIECNKCLCINADKHCFRDFHQKLATAAVTVQQPTLPSVKDDSHQDSDSALVQRSVEQTVERRVPIRRAAKHTLPPSDDSTPST